MGQPGFGNVANLKRTPAPDPPTPDWAHEQVSRAVKRGELVRPETCERCGDRPTFRLHGHHEDYSKPLEVEWLCPSCHRYAHTRSDS